MTIFLRSPRIASRVFGWDTPGQLVTRTPRARFMFKAEFQPSDDANKMLYQAPLNKLDSIKGVAFKVKTIDKPRVNLTTVDLNQYNKKKIAYTRVDYSEATIRLYDTVDNSVLNLWIDYFTFFFGDSRLKDSDAYSQSSVNKTFTDGTGWGFRPISANSAFFKYISVNALFGNTLTSFRYINPKITSIDWHDKDYTATDLEEVTITFKYEAIQYDLIGRPYKDKDLLDDGFTNDDWRYVTLKTPTAFKAEQPRLFNNQLPVYNTTQLDSQIKNPITPPVTPPTTTTTPTTTFPPYQTPAFDNFTGGYTGFDNVASNTSEQPISTTNTSGNTTVTTTTTTTNEYIYNVAGVAWVPGQELTSQQIRAVTLRTRLGNSYPPAVMDQYRKQTGGTSSTVDNENNNNSNISAYLIAGVPWQPGKEFSKQQLSVIKMSLKMGNTFPASVLEQYNKQTS